MAAEPKTWKEIKKYTEENKDELAEGDWGEVRFLTKKMTPKERAKMQEYATERYMDPDYLEQLREKQKDRTTVRDIEALKEKQRKERGID